MMLVVVSSEAALPAGNGVVLPIPLHVADTHQLQTVLNVATQLNHLMEQSRLSLAAVTDEHGAIYLPNASAQLVAADSLCFNDCSWLPDQSDMAFAHNLIPYQIAKRLGVNTKRQVGSCLLLYSIPSLPPYTEAHTITFRYTAEGKSEMQRTIKSIPFYCGWKYIMNIEIIRDFQGVEEVFSPAVMLPPVCTCHHYWKL